MYIDSTEVVHAAKRLAIRHVRDVLETDEVSPLVRRQLAGELDRAVGRMRLPLADEFRATYEAEFEDALGWAREQRQAILELQEAERVADDLRRFRIDAAQTKETWVFREPEVLRNIPEALRRKPDMLKRRRVESATPRPERRAPAEISAQKAEPSGLFQENKYFLVALTIIASPFAITLISVAVAASLR